jgi:c-di-AMP phosphodiesterase-like protein
MESLGGGGHLTMAGAQLENVTVEQAKEKLISVIEKSKANKKKP